VKEYSVVLTEAAERDLSSIFDYIADRASPDIALHFVEGIVTYCLGLGTAPERGTRRDDLRPGLRTIGFKRRATVLFEIAASQQRVVIHGTYYAGRSVERDFEPKD
jgi:toxin ParE1/3/4